MRCSTSNCRKVRVYCLISRISHTENRIFLIFYFWSSNIFSLYTVEWRQLQSRERQWARCDGGINAGAVNEFITMLHLQGSWIPREIAKPTNPSPRLLSSPVPFRLQWPSSPVLCRATITLKIKMAAGLVIWWLFLPSILGKNGPHEPKRFAISNALSALRKLSTSSLVIHYLGLKMDMNKVSAYSSAMFDRIKSAAKNATVTAVSATVNAVGAVGSLIGNPLTKDYEVGKHVASFGPNLTWKIYEGRRKTTGQVRLLNLLISWSQNRTLFDALFLFERIWQLL